ncbi:glycoside hydrolase family 2 protein [Aureibaculum marinum]|uniref:Glycoside hydrolase family 2 protein n=1 Tax=Aureibaculum marinum TaxID=2487930 RepID=A0A3N4PHT5_9FLAO|nr:glycoside hydrolase family 2 TIM barrel-domain containing protein [Aureibaculum marinum]RPD99113.1 glycoside hydrolase family 2 protein [Aureibaculum marinum]
MMKKLLILLTFVISTLNSCKKEILLNRETDFNFDWKFTLIEDTLSVFNTPLIDSNWKDIRLPHDWSVEASFDESLEGCTGYLPGGVAWYHKHFSTPINPKNQNAFILFDGVYNNAKFWINGHYLGENPYGYSPVYFDLTDKLNTNGEDNILSVYVDHSRYADSRWYTGSGIYRNVKLITTNKLHIPIWGTFVTTPEITKEVAKINIEITVKNDNSNSESYEIETNILDKSDSIVTSSKQKKEIKPDEEQIINLQAFVNKPTLWNVNTPYLYKAQTILKKAGKIIGLYETPFGIRSIKHSKKEGLLINGIPTLAKGVCLHHDAGIVGSAVPKEVWRRRLLLLKQGGVNAIRTSHNPFSKEFLDLCDELGFLVQAELFDEFDYPKDKRLNYHERKTDYITTGYTKKFHKWGKSDVTRTILRDRNHPSIFEWSIGNEIEWTYLNYRYVTGFWKDPEDSQNSGNYWGSSPIFSPDELKKRYNNSKKGEYILAETAKKINAWVKELDTTRKTTANLVIPQVSHISGYADAVDLVGYSYRNIDIPWANKHFPHKQITINECPGSWEDWKTVTDNPEVYSMYMWSGIAYLGEAHNQWPKKVFLGDMLNLAGFKNQGFNYFKSIWVDKPHVSIGTIPLKKSGFHINKDGKVKADSDGSYRWRNSNMHWNYIKGDSVLVEVNTNQKEVELFLNETSLGIKRLIDNKDHILRWFVPFTEGKLTAKTTNSSASAILETTTKPTQFSFESDKKELNADGYDVAHLVVQLKDNKNRDVKTFNKKVTFKIEGEAKLLGVDNGLPENVQKFQSNTIITGDGRCLLIIQSIRGKRGLIKVIASIDGFSNQEVQISIK